MSAKTDNTYRWNDFGDVTEVEYQDLMGLRASNSGFLFKPLLSSKTKNFWLMHVGKMSKRCMRKFRRMMSKLF